MKRRWLRTVGVLVAGVAAAPCSAPARAASGLDVRLERDTRPGILSSDLVVNLKVTITDPEAAAPPEDTFEVYAFAEQPGGTRTEIFPCVQEHDSDPGVLRGVYLCTVLVDHGGRWRFSGVVNQSRADPDAPPVPLGQAATELDIVTAEVAASADTGRIKGRVLEVVLLWTHAAAAAVWFVAVTFLAVLGLPALRRRLSTFGLHRLEDRFDLIAKSLWAGTGLLVASGTYLLLNQTAYETPFSTTRIQAAFRLPYGQPYFLALVAKLSVYAVMLAASLVLLSEARRRLRSRLVTAPPELEDAPVLVRGGAVALIAGTAGLSLSITLLKYFHELIEATRAAL